MKLNAARQKDQARSSVSELMLALKNPRSLSESRNCTFKRKSQEADCVFSTQVPGKRTSESRMRGSLQKISEVPQGGNRISRKSGLRSLIGYGNK